MKGGVGCNLDGKEERAHSGKEGGVWEQTRGAHRGARGGSPLTAEGATVRRAPLTGALRVGACL